MCRGDLLTLQKLTYTVYSLLDYKKKYIKEGNVGSPVRQPSLAHVDVYKHGHSQCLFHGTCCTPGGQAPLAITLLFLVLVL